MSMSDTNWSLHNRWSTVSAGVLVTLLFLTRSFREFEKKSCSSKISGFSTNKLSLERGISSCFFSSLILSFHIIPISADNEFSPLRNYIFKRRNLFIKYVSKYKNRLFMYKYNWKDLKELFHSDFWVILSYFETITRWRFHSRPYARREVFNIIFIHVW